MPLTHLESGENAVLLNLNCGQRLISRLSALGFTPGVAVRMVQNYHRGPLIIAVRGSQVALGRGEADQMLVRRGCV